MKKRKEKEWVPWVGWRAFIYATLVMVGTFVCTMTQISSEDPMGHLSQWYYYISLTAFSLAFLAEFYSKIRFLAYEFTFFYISTFTGWAWLTFLLWLFYSKDMKEGAMANAPANCTAVYTKINYPVNEIYIPTLEEMMQCPAVDIGNALYMIYIHFIAIIVWAFIFVPQHKYNLVDYYRGTWNGIFQTFKGYAIAFLCFYIFAQIYLPFSPIFIFLAIFPSPTAQYDIMNPGTLKPLIAMISTIVIMPLSQAFLLWYLRVHHYFYIYTFFPFGK